MTPEYIIHPEGSVLVAFGDTKVLCNATVEEGVPPFLRDTGSGWVTGEYAMLPRATNTRNKRESRKGKPDGRSQEISRLIGRALRAGVDMDKLGEYTVTLDCDVLQADGGTRTAAITGGFVALQLAFNKMMTEGLLKENPVKGMVAAVSVGVVDGEPVLDLNYIEDSNADVDMNVVAREGGLLIEVQGSAEKDIFDLSTMDKMMKLALNGIEELIAVQKEVLNG